MTFKVISITSNHPTTLDLRSGLLQAEKKQATIDRKSDRVRRELFKLKRNIEDKNKDGVSKENHELIRSMLDIAKKEVGRKDENE